MTRLTIVNARAVLPDEVLEGATVRVEDGLIREIAPLRPAAWGEVIDAQGAYLVPGVVDLHSDNLEKEINPRPNATMPLPFAFEILERRIAGYGVTTAFHSISFMEADTKGRTIEEARARTAFISAVSQAGDRLIDHHVLHRIDVWHPHALDLVFESLADLPVRYASLNDHTPGQGQLHDLERLLGRTPGEELYTRESLQARMDAAAANAETVAGVYRRVKAEAAERPFVIASHDDHTPEKVDAQWHIGATIAEFPVTLEAAQRARDRGMVIVVGAPNVVRGQSQSGNLAARDLIAAGLADALCADYHPPSLLAAVFRLVRDGLADLPAAMRMVSRTPARAVGLHDRGAIIPGLRADLVLVRPDHHGFPRVELTIANGSPVLTYAGSSSILAALDRA